MKCTILRFPEYRLNFDTNITISNLKRDAWEFDAGDYLIFCTFCGTHSILWNTFFRSYDQVEYLLGLIVDHTTSVQTSKVNSIHIQGKIRDQYLDLSIENICFHQSLYNLSRRSLVPKSLVVPHLSEFIQVEHARVHPSIISQKLNVG